MGRCCDLEVYKGNDIIHSQKNPQHRNAYGSGKERGLGLHGRERTQQLSIRCAKLDTGSRDSCMV